MTTLTRRLSRLCVMTMLTLGLAPGALGEASPAEEGSPGAEETASAPSEPRDTEDALPSLEPEPAESDSGPVVIQREPEPIAPPPIRELHLVLDWYPGPQHAALLIAEARGYIERQGISLRITTPADPSVPTKLVAASRADLALGRQPQLHLQVDRGLPLIRVATLLDTPLSSLTVREDSGIDTMTQLAGKTIGFSVEDSVEPVLVTMLNQHGLELADVEIEDVNFALIQALAERRVDAVISTMREITSRQLEQDGIRSHGFLAEQHGLPAYDALILIANRDRLEARRGDIKRLIRAIEEASHWILNNPDEAWELLAETEPGLDTTANRRAWPATLARLSMSPSALDVGRYDRFETFLDEGADTATRHPVSRLAVDLNAP